MNFLLGLAAEFNVFLHKELLRLCHPRCGCSTRCLSSHLPKVTAATRRHVAARSQAPGLLLLAVAAFPVDSRADHITLDYQHPRHLLSDFFFLSSDRVSWSFLSSGRVSWSFLSSGRVSWRRQNKVKRLSQEQTSVQVSNLI